MVRILYKIVQRIEERRDNLYFGKIGKKSKVVKPMRIIGKKRIFIGDSVTILNSARMEAVKTWGGGGIERKNQDRRQDIYRTMLPSDSCQ